MYEGSSEGGQTAEICPSVVILELSRTPGGDRRAKSEALERWNITISELS